MQPQSAQAAVERRMILVPVKNLADAKQRLSSVLSPEERFALARAMCEDVLQALARWQSRPAVAVVTSDSFARDLAARFNFEVVADDNSGETSAIEMATAVCRERGARSTLGGSGRYSFDRQCRTAEDRRPRSSLSRRCGASARRGGARHECSMAISRRLVSASLRQRQLPAAPGRREGNRPALCCAQTSGDCAGCRSSRRSSRTSGCQWRSKIAEAGAKLEPWRKPESGRGLRSRSEASRKQMASSTGKRAAGEVRILPIAVSGEIRAGESLMREVVGGSAKLGAALSGWRHSGGEAQNCFESGRRSGRAG